MKRIVSKNEINLESIKILKSKYFPESIKDSAANNSFFLINENILEACCSIWTVNTPSYKNLRTACIGHFFTSNIESGIEILQYSENELKKENVEYIIGPMDGNTWHSYRLITDYFDSNPFFLEYYTDPVWKEAFEQFGFKNISSFSSAIINDLNYKDESAERFRKKLDEFELKIRNFNINSPIEDLKKVYKLSLLSFSNNFLYTPISEEDFFKLYNKIIPYIDPDFFILVEHNNDLIAYIFAIPDYCQKINGKAIDRIIIKTVAKLPGEAYQGIGNFLVFEIQNRAYEKNYSSTIHALMHDENISRFISNKCAKKIRTYELFGKGIKDEHN